MALREVFTLIPIIPIIDLVKDTIGNMQKKVHLVQN